MKYLVVLSVIAAVASAGIVKPAVVDSAVSEVQQIIAAINSPSTDPATAAALEQLLLDTLGISSAQNPSPISVGPAIVEFPIPAPDGGAVTAETPVAPAPVATPAADASAPLVQIVLNINQASSDAAAVAPAAVEAPVISGNPVSPVRPVPGSLAVGPAPSRPVPGNIVAPVVPGSPVNVVDEAVNVEPVQVVEEPVHVAILPIVPEEPAVVNLPDILN